MEGMTFPLAGPIEFGPAEVAIILVALVVLFLGVPSIGGLIAYLIYRARVPATERSKGRSLGVFALGFAGSYVLFFVFSIARSIIDCIGSEFC